MRAFADALDSVPMALAENSGLSPIETLANIKSRQAKEKNTRLGVDCMQTGSNGKCTTHISSSPLSYLVRIPTIGDPWVSAVRSSFCLDRCCWHTACVVDVWLRGPVVHTSTRFQRLHGM
jgi:hypothetical protein